MKQINDEAKRMLKNDKSFRKPAGKEDKINYQRKKKQETSWKIGQN